jgi:hypothetical protein
VDGHQLTRPAEKRQGVFHTGFGYKLNSISFVCIIRILYDR